MNRFTVNYHGILWEEDAITVYQPENGGTGYPRLFSADGKRLWCAMDVRGENGNTAVGLVYSDDQGLTWTPDPVVVSVAPECSCTNAAFAFHRGEMLIAYRACRKGSDAFSGRLLVSKSLDMIHWELHSTIAEEVNEGFFGVWEPHFGTIDGKLAVFYANDSRRVVEAPSMQNIEYKLWDDETGTWGETHIASNGNQTKSRDGMPVWCPLQSGGYGLMIEATTQKDSHPFIIQHLYSPDGFTWTKPKDVYIPHTAGKKAGAPYLVQIPDGRIVAAFQTDEDSTDTGDRYSIMKLTVSKTPWRQDLTVGDFEECFVPFPLPDGSNGLWNGMYLFNGMLYAVSGVNYPSSHIVIRRAKV